ncbi:EF-hand domain-containing protein [Allorhizobium undicola]|uniref:EF-hand domain-containing protein n=1 Tax=Allorhizobium undicola TaxID=78527 RepID=UPI003D356487
MNTRKTTLSALAAVLLVSTSFGAVMAEEGKGPKAPPEPPGDAACGPRPMMMRGPAAMFIHALQQFDANKDGKISKDEAKGAEEKLFAAIDTNKDGTLTPGELRKFHEARMEAMKAEKPPMPPKPEDGKAPPPPPGGPDKAANDAKGPPDGAMPGMGPMDDEDGPMGGCGPMGPDHAGPGPKGHEGPGERGHDRHGPEFGERDGPHHGPHQGMMGPKHMFRELDTDENGQISKAEADAGLDKLFDRLDTNKDGFISADDFPAGPALIPAGK